MHWWLARTLLVTTTTLVGKASGLAQDRSKPDLRIPPFRRHVCAAMLALLVIMVASSPVLGQNRQPTATLNALERLEQAVQKEAGLSPETKDALHALINALRAERTGRAGARPGVPAEPVSTTEGEISTVNENLPVRSATRQEALWEGVLDRLTAYGDLRLRAESNVNLDHQPARHRQRVRFRFGTNYKLTDEILIGGRITTGDPADPQSPHQTLGNVFHSFDISLDRAFMTYRPAWLQGSWLTAGKFGHSFQRNPVYSELVWDADVQPEGAVTGYTFAELGGLESLGFTGGYYILLEQSRADEGAVSVFQVSSRLRLAEHLRANLGAGYYLYSDVTPSGSRAILDENSGNRTVDRDSDGTPDDFLSRFGILNPIAGLTYDRWKLPLTLSAEYILNTRARVEQDQGWAVGASLGKARNRGDWRFYYQWQVVEQDAVFSPVAQDDFLLATNHRSHVFGVNYQLIDKVGLHLWALVSARDKAFPDETTDSDKNQWRLRLDMNYKF